MKLKFEIQIFRPYSVQNLSSQVPSFTVPIISVLGHPLGWTNHSHQNRYCGFRAIPQSWHYCNNLPKNGISQNKNFLGGSEVAHLPQFCQPCIGCRQDQTQEMEGYENNKITFLWKSPYKGMKIQRKKATKQNPCIKGSLIIYTTCVRFCVPSTVKHTGILDTALTLSCLHAMHIKQPDVKTVTESTRGHPNEMSASKGGGRRSCIVREVAWIL